MRSKTVEAFTKIFVNRLFLPGFATIIFPLAGCGGASSAGTTPPPSTTQVTVTCPAQIQVGVASTTYGCTASAPVTWSVSNTMLASISASGVLTPAQATTGTITVTATPTSTSYTAGTTGVNVVDQIIYAAVGATGQIMIANASGSGATQVTTGCYNPEFFADHLSFVCTGVTGNQLFVYTTNGTSAVLKATLSWTNLGQPDVASVSPNGSTLAFRAYDTSLSKFGTYQANVDGTNMQVLVQEAACTGSCIAIGQPRYSADGTKIVYSHVVSGVSQVCTMSASGANQSCLTAGTDGAFNPTGTVIYFTGTGGVRSIGSTGGGVSNVIVSNAYGAMTSPNGLKLVFGSSAGVSTSASDGNGQQTLAASGSHGSW